MLIANNVAFRYSRSGNMIQASYFGSKGYLHRTMYEAPPQLPCRSTSPTDATIFTPTSIFPSHLRTRSAAAERTTPLECVGVASQSTVFNTGQLISTCVTRLASSLYMLCLELTVVDAVGHTSAALSVDVADILLQARSRDTASSLRNRTVRVGALRHGSCKTGDGKNDGGGGELHFRMFVDWYYGVVGNRVQY
jgi:hypothetical protein